MVENIREAAVGSRARAPNPYTVSVGKATHCCACRIRDAWRSASSVSGWLISGTSPENVIEDVLHPRILVRCMVEVRKKSRRIRRKNSATEANAISCLDIGLDKSWTRRHTIDWLGMRVVERKE